MEIKQFKCHRAKFLLVNAGDGSLLFSYFYVSILINLCSIRFIVHCVRTYCLSCGVRMFYPRVTNIKLDNQGVLHATKKQKH